MLCMYCILGALCSFIFKPLCFSNDTFPISSGPDITWPNRVSETFLQHELATVAANNKYRLNQYNQQINTNEQCSKFLIPSYWLVYSNSPNWITIITNILGSIIPQLVINQTSFITLYSPRSPYFHG